MSDDENTDNGDNAEPEDDDFAGLRGIWGDYPFETETDVFLRGKREEHKHQDNRLGQARFGGKRTPDYARAYFKATEQLADSAEADPSLWDVLGLPLFYLQRHTVELMLKRFIGQIHHIKELKQELPGPAPEMPSKREKRRLNEHKLDSLLRDLKRGLDHLSLSTPDVLENIVTEITEFEQKGEESEEYRDHTWSRYSRSAKGADFLESEVVIPCKKIQNQLRDLASELTERGYPDDRAQPGLEFRLHNKFKQYLQRHETMLERRSRKREAIDTILDDDFDCSESEAKQGLKVLANWLRGAMDELAQTRGENS